MNGKLKQELKKVWDYQKLMNLDFRGTSREKLIRKFNLSEDAKIGVYFGGALVTAMEKNYTIAGVVLAKDYGEIDVEYAYSFSELLKIADSFLEKYPKDKIFVFFGYEVHKLNSEGRMDVCGEEDLERRKVVIKNGEIVEGKVEVE